jgi:NADH dehydrogenase
LPRPLGRLQAWIGEYLVPGKPFTRDNFRSLTVANICRENGFGAFGIKPKPMEPIAHAYIGGAIDELSLIRQGGHH